MPTPPVTSLVLILANLGLLALLGVFVFRSIRKKLRAPTAFPALRDEGSDTRVLATFTGIKGLSPWLTIASNSLNPAFKLDSDTLEYRVLKRRQVAVSHIQSVRMMTTIGTVNLHFTFKTGPFTFTANVGDQQRARTILSRLDPAIIRDQ